MYYIKYIRSTILLGALAVFTKHAGAQQENFTPVVNATVSSYALTSYQYMNSVTLTNGFTFTAGSNSSFPVFSIIPEGKEAHPDISGLAANNNVRTDIIKVPGVTSQSQITASNSQTQMSYMDGLGRTVEKITMQGSPGLKDIVQFMAYDQYGRQPKQYLPYTAATNDGSYQSNPATAQQTFYQVTNQQIAVDNYPYAITSYDNSPLERVIEAGAPGANWQLGQHTQKSQFRLNNTTDNIGIWTTAGPSGSNYPAAKLQVQDITDENGNHVLSFTNQLGQLVDKKVQSDASTWLETVYVYDDLGNLVYQVSPEGVKHLSAGTETWSTSFINTWACIYTYDAKNRLVAKQSPGAAPVYMVYDSYNRMVLMQDGRLRNAYGTSDKWYFTKYDAANRPIISGLYTYIAPSNPNGATHQLILQNYLDGLTYDNVTNFAFEKRASGTTYGYSDQSFPATVADADVLTVNYYDDYDFNNNGTPPNQYVNPNQTGFATVSTTDASGLLTGTRKRIINTSGNNGGWINQAIFYDNFGNAIQKQTNSLLNQTALDITSIAVDIYAGRVTQTQQIKTQGTTVKVLNKLSYDHMDRLTQVTLNINGGTDKVIAAYDYNELGQLKDKKLGATSSGYLQTVDYRYNIRGWLTSINNSSLSSDGGITNNDGSNDIWGETILYDQADATGLSNTPKFNGKISEIKWKVNDQFSSSPNPVRERSYIYTYDSANRLKTAHYAANGGSAWNAETGGYDENIGSYDNNGNIKSLTRYSWAQVASSPTLIDNLTYGYQNTNGSNQLASVGDVSGSTLGFNDGASNNNEYQYDTDGNLTQDANKKEIITYNDLNKVSKIAITSGGSMEYIYDASGTRIRKTVFDASHNIMYQYDYLDGFVYIGGALAYFNMAEGRVLTGSGFTYEYFIKDHLGDTRVSFQDNGSGVAKITQDNEYYAFGMTMQGIVVRTGQPSPTIANTKLYNGGSEEQNDLGFENSYSTSYRDYDQVLGRFNAIDPSVDQYGDWTPYNFAFNDPVGMNDPDGADPNGNNPWATPSWNPYVGPPDQPNPNSGINWVPSYVCYTCGTGLAITSSSNQNPQYASAHQSLQQFQLLENLAWNPILHDAKGSYYYQQVYSPFATSDGSVNINAVKVYVSDNNANQGGMTHDQELAKYGQIITAYNLSAGASLAQFGATVETGVIMTDKGWARAYKTVYYSPGFASPSGALGFSVVSPISNKYLPTFSDWKGAMVGFSGSADFISGNVGFTSAYFVWGLGLSAAPESLTIPAMKGVNGSGSMNLGVTSWVGAPFQVGNLNLPGADRRYINTMQYQGGY